MGFHLFSAEVHVSHAYVHLTGFGKPVKIGGLLIRPGELIHGDKHGICVIPHAIATRLPEACRAMEELERPLIELARSPDFSPAKYVEARKAFKEQFEEVSKRLTRT